MKRLTSILLLTLSLFSCANLSGAGKGTGQGGEKAGGESKQAVPPSPPSVTGEVKLVFEKTFGDEARIFSPWGISFGVDGTLYVCDRDRSSVVRLDEDGGSITRFSGFGARVERLYTPIDVCSSAGMAIYALDAANSRVLRFDRNLKNSFVIYKRDQSKNRLFGSFNGLAFDKTSGDLFVTDRDTGSLIRIDMLGKTITSRGAFGSTKESFRLPAGLDVADNGAVIVADKGAGAVAILDHFGARIRYVGGNVLETPLDVAALPNGRLAVADRSGIVILSGEGTALGAAGYGEDRTMSPRSVAYREGRLYVSDGDSGSILVYTITSPGR